MELNWPTIWVICIAVVTVVAMVVALFFHLGSKASHKPFRKGGCALVAGFFALLAFGFVGWAQYTEYREMHSLVVLEKSLKSTAGIDIPPCEIVDGSVVSPGGDDLGRQWVVEFDGVGQRAFVSLLEQKGYTASYYNHELCYEKEVKPEVSLKVTFANDDKTATIDLIKR